ncbi:MAG: FMN reductase [Nocardioides sp.]|nr:FMN reductase [Nocardioides sp.]
MTRVLAISAGLSVPSSTRLLTDRVADAVRRAAGPGTEVEVVDLRPFAHALADHLLTGFASGELAELIERVRHVDGLVMVTPVFSASYSGLFKTFVDVLEPGLLDGKPVLIGATAGTARHSLVLDHALRPLFSYLRAVVVPTGVFAATDDFGETGLTQRVDQAAGELAGLVKGRRALHVVRDEFADPTPFEERLRPGR